MAAGADWAAQPVEARAACLERAADALEDASDRFLALLMHEAGKTVADAVAEGLIARAGGGISEAEEPLAEWERELLAGAEAAAEASADSTDPSTMGCGGFPWSRLTPTT
mgnify:CR=1 FL=1